ncbi:type II secretion system secretin GspD [Sphingomonas sp.]|jgi:general secretion pathway protein D|uniref:type II secretion system secretin GspD n=1 Tax=Sphingomonas sp. TaxID=28214 RepID=UPI002E349778|nr:type II secretion system secretin GspD [Sphingomonas sp.]HEX4693973.1 type II secretion system secretin GspD [Sphingomonas sp.]
MRKFTLTAALIALAIADPLVAQTTVNVRDADIRAYIADAARVTGRTFIIDSRVQGKVTVVSERPLSRSEYFETFLSTLRANGYVAVPTSNGAFRIQPIEGAATQPSRIGAAGANRNQFVTEIIRLRLIDAGQAIDSVRSLVSPQGSVSANRGSNAVVVVDFADNVRRVREVLRRLDTDGAATSVVALQNANAKEIATALSALIGGGGAAGGPGTGASNATVVAIESSNSIAIRGDVATVARLAAMARDLDRKAKSGQEIRVVFLENADAAQLLPVLQQLVGQAVTQPPETQGLSAATSIGGNSTGGTTTTTTTAPVPAVPVTTTTTTGSNTPAITGIGGRSASVITRFAGANAIVIAAPAEVQRQLADVIAKLDTRRQQVLVEAIVAEVSDTTAAKLGAQFLLGNITGGAFAASTFSNSAPNILQIAGAIGARQLATTTTTVNGTTTVTTTNNTVSDSLAQSAISSILGSSGGFAGFGGRIGDTIFGSIINAVKSDTTSNLLQSPSITVIDNTEARILVGQEVPVTTGQALSNNFDNTFRTTQRENVGIQLQVRPQVNSGGSVKLYLRQQVSSIAGPVSSDNSDLVFNKREIETVQTVDDGQIAVIGGLLSDEERRTIEKIPLLGDIPILGNLFKSKGKSRTKTNLMVFIRATILRTPEDMRRVTEQRYGYLRLQQAGQRPDEEPSIDQLVRDYMGAAPPIPPAPLPGNIDDPRITVPTMITSTTRVKRK